MSRARNLSPTQNFYPRPPRGGRRLFPGGLRLLEGLISIHALREEGDVEPLTAGVMPLLFLSTPSARRATLVYSR